MSFHNWRLQRTIAEKIHALMCYHERNTVALGIGKSSWRNEDFCKTIGCSRSAANRALNKLSYAVAAERHYFRTDGGVVLEYIYSLK
jgi:hypothetical protein